MTARLQRSAGGVPLSLRSWLSHLFRGRPGPRLQLGSGRRSSDPVCGTARLGGQVCPLEVWQHVQTVSCDDRQTIGSSKGPRPVREETSVFRTWSCQRISYILGPVHTGDYSRRKRRQSPNRQCGQGFRRWHFMWKASSFLICRRRV